jgi:mannose-6-phosphate isomerase-like protein (cupin superfamily)
MSTYEIDVIAASGDFRRVIVTGSASQLVTMCLRPGEEIGEEVHQHGDQILQVVEGEADVILEGSSTRLGAGGIAFVPAGTRHNVVNAGGGNLRLLSTYAPPEHPDGTVHATKAEADAAEHHQ